MLKRSLRLNRKEVALFFKNRSFYKKGNIVSLRYVNNKKKTPRFAFIVSVFKKSTVKRNLARRRISEIVGSELNILPNNLDMVFFLKLSQDKKIPKTNQLKKDILNVISSFNI